MQVVLNTAVLEDDAVALDDLERVLATRLGATGGAVRPAADRELDHGELRSGDPELIGENLPCQFDACILRIGLVGGLRLVRLFRFRRRRRIVRDGDALVDRRRFGPFDRWSHGGLDGGRGNRRLLGVASDEADETRQDNREASHERSNAPPRPRV
jgi:hypothetical protein